MIEFKIVKSVKIFPLKSFAYVYIYIRIHTHVRDAYSKSTFQVYLYVFTVQNVCEERDEDTGKITAINLHSKLHQLEEDHDKVCNVDMYVCYNLTQKLHTHG